MDRRTVAEICLEGILLAAGMNALYKRTRHYRNQYENAEKFMAGVPEGLDIGCFGSSYAKFGFDFSQVKLKGFNFGVFPQPLIYDYELLKQYHDRFRKGADILLTFAPLSFLLGEYPQEEAQYKYYRMLKPEGIRRYRRLTKLLKVDFPLFSDRTLVRYLFVDEGEIFSSGEWRTDHNLFSRNGVRDQAGIRADGWMRQFGIASLRDVEALEGKEEIIRQNTVLVEKMASYCKAHGTTPWLVIPPVSRELAGFFTPEFLEACLYQPLRRISSAQKVELLDYWQDDRFQNYGLYLNSDFMNSIGRKKLTIDVCRRLGLAADQEGAKND